MGTVKHYMSLSHDRVDPPTVVQPGSAGGKWSSGPRSEPAASPTSDKAGAACTARMAGCVLSKPSELLRHSTSGVKRVQQRCFSRRLSPVPQQAQQLRHTRQMLIQWSSSAVGCCYYCC